MFTMPPGQLLQQVKTITATTAAAAATTDKILAFAATDNVKFKIGPNTNRNAYRPSNMPAAVRRSRNLPIEHIDTMDMECEMSRVLLSRPK